MNKILLAILILGVSVQAKAGEEITNPSDMATCVRRYIVNELVDAGTMSWEHEPTFVFLGKYVHASWITNATESHASLSANLGPQSPVYCDYELKADGSADMSKPGFCKATVVNATVMFAGISWGNGKRVTSKEDVVAIVDSKIYCQE